MQARKKLHLQGKYCFVEFSGPLCKHCGSASGFFLPVSYLRLFQGAPGSQMPEVRKICASGELAVSKGDRMDLGTLPGVSENPGVGLVGASCTETSYGYTCGYEGLFIYICVYTLCVHVNNYTCVCIYPCGVCTVAAAGVKGWDEGWGWGGGASSGAGVGLIHQLGQPQGNIYRESSGRSQGQDQYLLGTEMAFGREWLEAGGHSTLLWPFPLRK